MREGGPSNGSTAPGAHTAADAGFGDNVRCAPSLAEYDRRPEWQREAWLELPEAFDFRLAGEEVLDGNGLYVIEATPRQGYQPRSRTAKVLAHVEGKFWVDKEDYHLVKVPRE